MAGMAGAGGSALFRVRSHGYRPAQETSRVDADAPREVKILVAMSDRGGEGNERIGGHLPFDQERAPPLGVEWGNGTFRTFRACSSKRDLTPWSQSATLARRDLLPKCQYGTVKVTPATKWPREQA